MDVLRLFHRRFPRGS